MRMILVFIYREIYYFIYSKNTLNSWLYKLNILIQLLENLHKFSFLNYYDLNKQQA